MTKTTTRKKTTASKQKAVAAAVERDSNTPDPPEVGVTVGGGTTVPSNDVGDERRDVDEREDEEITDKAPSAHDAVIP